MNGQISMGGTRRLNKHYQTGESSIIWVECGLNIADLRATTSDSSGTYINARCEPEYIIGQQPQAIRRVGLKYKLSEDYTGSVGMVFLRANELATGVSPSIMKTYGATFSALRSAPIMRIDRVRYVYGYDDLIWIARDQVRGLIEPWVEGGDFLMKPFPNLTPITVDGSSEYCLKLPESGKYVTFKTRNPNPNVTTVISVFFGQDGTDQKIYFQTPLKKEVGGIWVAPTEEECREYIRALKVEVGYYV